MRDKFLWQTRERVLQFEGQPLAAELTHQFGLTLDQNNLALTDDADPIGHLFCFLDVVGGENDVTPDARRRRTKRHISWRSSTSTPAVGSSRNRICGSCARALAIRTRRFMPPDRVLILSSFLSHRDRSRKTVSM